MDPNQENQGENSAGGSRQAIFTPQPPVVEGEAPTIPASAQASDGSSIHPYFSSHPTQTFNTEAGDIILNTSAPKPKQNKRPFIIGGVILAVFVLICVVLLVLLSPNSKSKLLNTLEPSVQYVKDLEELFYESARDNTMAYKILTPDAYKKINAGMNCINAIHNQLESIKANDKIASIQKQLAELRSSYQNTVTTYNELYLAYQDNSEQALSKLANSDYSAIGAIATRIMDFLDTRNYWQQVITNNCSDAESQSCKEAEIYYNENQATLEANTSIARLLFTTYISQPYTKEKMLYPQLQELISELKNA